MSIFSRSKKVLGLDITSERIRYVVAVQRNDTARLISYGEERVPDLEPHNALLSTLRDIKRATKTANALVALPSDMVRSETVTIPKTSPKEVLHTLGLGLTEEGLFAHDEAILYFEAIESVNERVMYKVFISSEENARFFKSVFMNAGIDILGLKSPNEALVSSCVKRGSLIPTMVLNLESESSGIALFSPFSQVRSGQSISSEHLIETIKEIYLDFYKENKEKIGYVFAAGSQAADTNLLNYLSRETRSSIEEAHVLENFTWKEHELPMMSKEESFSYAVALGLVIR